MIAPLKDFKRVASGRSKLAVASLALLVVGSLARPLPGGGDESKTQQNKDPLEAIDRRIVKEPKYASSPRYLLLVPGAKAETKVWLVEDGKTLYVDKNANGDLTDDGPPIEPTKLRQFETPKGTSWDFEYVLDRITPADGSQHTAFCLRRWNYGDPEDEYGLSLTLNDKTPMYAGWSIAWAKSPEAAPIIHFGGPLQPHLLRRKDFILDPGSSRLSIAFINPGRGKDAHSRLSIDALPRDVVPQQQIEWPVAEGAPALRTVHRLTERCCYWEFYELAFKVPAGAVPGAATVKVSLPAGALPLELATDQIKVPVRVRAKESDTATK